MANFALKSGTTSGPLVYSVTAMGGVGILGEDTCIIIKWYIWTDIN